MTSLKVAVVGAGGQIGPHLLAELARDPLIQARGICRNEVSAAPLRMEGFDIRCGSVHDDAVASRLLGDCDVIVNCSSASGAPAKVRIAERAVACALSRLPGQKRLIQFSSVAVYGTCIVRRRTAFKRPRPDQAYGRQKLYLEHYLRRCVRQSPHQCLVLRPGHVYGAGQWLSRFVLEKARDPQFDLPFDGALPSNAIHVRNVAAAIHELVLNWTGPGICNLLDVREKTWREVFDWNTNAIGAAPVPAMDVDESEGVAFHYRRLAGMPVGNRLASEMKSWIRTLPASFISQSPSTRYLGGWLLAALGNETLERRLRMIQTRRLSARSDAPVAEGWLLSQAAPGPRFLYDDAVRIEDAAAVADWHSLYATPDAVLSWPSPDVRSFRRQ